jgi:hypothetical protein
MTTDVLWNIVTDKFERNIQALIQTLTVSNRILLESYFDTINNDRLSMYKKKTTLIYLVHQKDQKQKIQRKRKQ